MELSFFFIYKNVKFLFKRNTFLLEGLEVFHSVETVVHPYKPSITTNTIKCIDEDQKYCIVYFIKALLICLLQEVKY